MCNVQEGTKAKVNARATECTFRGFSPMIKDITFSISRRTPLQPVATFISNSKKLMKHIVSAN